MEAWQQAAVIGVTVAAAVLIIDLMGETWQEAITGGIAVALTTWLWKGGNGGR